MTGYLSIKKLVAATGVSAIASLGAASEALALSQKLGNGSPSPSRAPVKGTLPGNQPLVVLKFARRKLVGLTGTAVAPGNRRLPGRTTATTARCSVNFTHATKAVTGGVSVDWFGGIGCTRSMFLFGQAYLQESATTVDGAGPHYQNVGSSASSGRRGTVINKPHPSLYIRHLTNVYFPVAPFSGQISVYPAAGQHLNKASKCVAASQPGHGVGVHCDLYTDRF